ncbi:MAG: hypothetical protein QG670_318 [Thermoproteota archaeon]|nr:hypothetical protein [Thermoproteota archaeon]
MTSLTRIFGSKAQTRLIQHLLDHRGRVYNQAGLSRLLGLSPSTVARVIEPLIEDKILNYEQVDGQMKIIALNEEDEKAKVIIEFYEKLKGI